MPKGSARNSLIPIEGKAVGACEGGWPSFATLTFTGQNLSDMAVMFAKCLVGGLDEEMIDE